MLDILPSIHTIKILYIVLLPSISYLQLIFVYDDKLKVALFMVALFGTLDLLELNRACAQTAVFLMRVILAQVFAIGFVVQFRESIVRLIVKDRHENQKLQWRCFYPIAIFLLALSSIIGLIYSIHTKLYLQMLQFPQLPYMLILTTIGFVVVYVSDYLLGKFTDISKINTVRRKIFHFVPLGLLPILSQISFKLFSLMVFGAFYLFWIGECVRYFGKLARNEDAKNKQQKSSQQKELLKQQQQLQTNSKTWQIIQTFHKLNHKFSQLPLIKWMQELNSSREPYFWFTHLSLILGLSLTYIYYYRPLSSIPRLINQNMSIILIISDAMAAIIGRKYGKESHQIPFTNKKTLEGYIGFVVTMIGLTLMSYFVCFWWHGLNFWNIQYKLVLISPVICGIGELFGGDLDNYVVVMVYILFEENYKKYMYG